MAGEIWIDAGRRSAWCVWRATCSRTWTLAGGSGGLDKGGWVEIDQADVGGRQWRIVHFQMKMSGRILFKTKNFDSAGANRVCAAARRALSYQKAIAMLRAGTRGTAQGRR